MDQKMTYKATAELLGLENGVLENDKLVAQLNILLNCPSPTSRRIHFFC